METPPESRKFAILIDFSDHQPPSLPLYLEGSELYQASSSVELNINWKVKHWIFEQFKSNYKSMYGIKQQ